MFRNSFKAVVWGIGAFAIFLTLTIATFNVGPSIENRLNPVMSGTVVINPHLISDGIEFGIYAIQERECKIESVSVLVRRGHVWGRGQIFAKDEKGEYTKTNKIRLKGDIVWDQYMVKPGGEEFSITGYYVCHPFWVTTVPLGTFRMLSANQKITSM